MNIIVESLLSDLEAGAIGAAKQAGIAALGDAQAGARQFLSTAEPMIERWVKGMFTQTLTKDDLSILVQDLAFDALVHTLTLGGMAEIEIDKTRNTLLKLATGIVSSALGKFIPI